jgi:hypothetical protein
LPAPLPQQSRYRSDPCRRSCCCGGLGIATRPCGILQCSWCYWVGQGRSLGRSCCRSAP